MNVTSKAGLQTGSMLFNTDTLLGKTYVIERTERVSILITQEYLDSAKTENVSIGEWIDEALMTCKIRPDIITYSNCKRGVVNV